MPLEAFEEKHKNILFYGINHTDLEEMIKDRGSGAPALPMNDTGEYTFIKATTKVDEMIYKDSFDHSNVNLMDLSIKGDVKKELKTKAIDKLAVCTVAVVDICAQKELYASSVYSTPKVKSLCSKTATEVDTLDNKKDVNVHSKVNTKVDIKVDTQVDTGVHRETSIEVPRIKQEFKPVIEVVESLAASKEVNIDPNITTEIKAEAYNSKPAQTECIKNIKCYNDSNNYLPDEVLLKPSNNYLPDEVLLKPSNHADNVSDNRRNCPQESNENNENSQNVVSNTKDQNADVAFNNDPAKSESGTLARLLMESVENAVMDYSKDGVMENVEKNVIDHDKDKLAESVENAVIDCDKDGSMETMENVLMDYDKNRITESVKNVVIDHDMDTARTNKTLCTDDKVGGINSCDSESVDNSVSGSKVGACITNDQNGIDSSLNGSSAPGKSALDCKAYDKSDDDKGADDNNVVSKSMGDSRVVDNSAVEERVGDYNTVYSAIDSNTGENSAGVDSVGDNSVGDSSVGNSSSGDNSVSDNSVDENNVDDNTVGSRNVLDSGAKAGSANVDSTVHNSTVNKGVVISSTAYKTTVDNSTVDKSTVNDSTGNKSAVDNSTVNKNVVGDSTVSKNMDDNGPVDKNMIGSSAESIVAAKAKTCTVTEHTVSSVKYSKTTVANTSNVNDNSAKHDITQNNTKTAPQMSKINVLEDITHSDSTVAVLKPIRTSPPKVMPRLGFHSLPVLCIPQQSTCHPLQKPHHKVVPRENTKQSNAPINSSKSQILAKESVPFNEELSHEGASLKEEGSTQDLALHDDVSPKDKDSPKKTVSTHGVTPENSNTYQVNSVNEVISNTNQAKHLLLKECDTNDLRKDTPPYKDIQSSDQDIPFSDQENALQNKDIQQPDQNTQSK